MAPPETPDSGSSDSSSNGVSTPTSTEPATPKNESQGVEATSINSAEEPKPAEAKADPPLKLPKWFLDNNVVLSDRILASSPKIHLLNPASKGSDKESKVDTPATQEKNDTDKTIQNVSPTSTANSASLDTSPLESADTVEDGNPSDIIYNVFQELYAEAQDTLLWGLQQSPAPGPQRNSWANMAAALVQSPRKGTLEFLDAVVHNQGGRR